MVSTGSVYPTGRLQTCTRLRFPVISMSERPSSCIVRFNPTIPTIIPARVSGVATSLVNPSDTLSSYAQNVSNSTIGVRGVLDYNSDTHDNRSTMDRSFSESVSFLLSRHTLLRPRSDTASSVDLRFLS